jgi:hypothetical protein
VTPNCLATPCMSREIGNGPIDATTMIVNLRTGVSADDSALAIPEQRETAWARFGGVRYWASFGAVSGCTRKRVSMGCGHESTRSELRACDHSLASPLQNTV